MTTHKLTQSPDSSFCLAVARETNSRTLGMFFI
jgi:hypothetical protein